MYDSDVSSVANALKDANPTVFSDSTISQILALSTQGNSKITFDTVNPDASGNVTVAAGAEVVLVGASDTLQTITPPKNAPVVIFQGKGGVITTLNDNVSVPSGSQTVDRIVVGSAGNDKITVADARNTKIILGSGNSTITTGQGVDTVEAGLGNSSIVGGNGDYAVVKLAGNASNYQVTTQNGHAIVTGANGKTTDISKIQYVQLDNGNALVFAKNSVEAAVTTLYQTAFGRTAEAGGLDFWFDAARSGATLKQIAEFFVGSQEFVAAHIGQDDTGFVQSLYRNTFGRAGEDAGVAYWTNALQSGGATKADLIASFAQIAANNIAGTAVNQEAQIVGSVQIVTGIV